jgi:hypothetical protein
VSEDVTPNDPQPGSPMPLLLETLQQPNSFFGLNQNATRGVNWNALRSEFSETNASKEFFVSRELDWLARVREFRTVQNPAVRLISHAFNVWRTASRIEDRPEQP